MLTSSKVDVPPTDVVNVEAVIPLFTETPLAPGVKVALPDELLIVKPEFEAVDTTKLFAEFVVIDGVEVELLPSTINSLAVIFPLALRLTHDTLAAVPISPSALIVPLALRLTHDILAAVPISPSALIVPLALRLTHDILAAVPISPSALIVVADSIDNTSIEVVPSNSPFNSLISGGLRIVLALILKFDFD
jgi:hypothetical protein